MIAITACGKGKDNNSSPSSTDGNVNSEQIASEESVSYSATESVSNSEESESNPFAGGLVNGGEYGAN